MFTRVHSRSFGNGEGGEGVGVAASFPLWPLVPFSLHSAFDVFVHAYAVLVLSRCVK